MKTVYSTWTSAHWKEYRKFAGTTSEQDYVAFAMCSCDAFCSAMGIDDAPIPIISLDMAIFAVNTYAAFLWKYRKITHFFLDAGVADFCVSAVKELTGDYLKALPSCEQVKAPYRKNNDMGFFEDLPGWCPGAFAIHFPVSEKRSSMIVIPSLKIAGQRVLFGATTGDHCAVLLDRPTHTGNFGDGFHAKLVFGLSLYMDAFPDAVVESNRVDIAQKHAYRGNYRSISRNAVVNHENRQAISPHWRRGHFRLLSSERFVKKKGMTIFINGMFVKGRAYDVKDDCQ